MYLQLYSFSSAAFIWFSLKCHTNWLPTQAFISKNAYLFEQASWSFFSSLTMHIIIKNKTASIKFGACLTSQHPTKIRLATFAYIKLEFRSGLQLTIYRGEGKAEEERIQNRKESRGQRILERH